MRNLFTMNESETMENSSDDHLLLINYHRSVEFKFAILAKYYPVAYNIDRFLPFIVYVIGFFGNSISAFVWFQRRLCKSNSSALYLALLSVNDLCYLLLHCVTQMDKVFVWQLSALPFYCEVFMYAFFIPQYLSPMFVLGFTAERFIAVCYPLRRRLLCRTRTAKIFAGAVVFAVAALAAAHPVFWTHHPTKGYCDFRALPGVQAAWQVFSLITEVFFFVVVPLLVLGLDLVVIVALCRIRRMRRERKRKRERMTVPLQAILSHGSDGKEVGEEVQRTEGGPERDQEPEQERSIKIPAQTTTALLLTVSLSEVLSLMSVSILYLQLGLYPRGDLSMSEDEIMADPTWLTYFRFSAAQCIVYSLSLIRHGVLLFFFLVIGSRFREVLYDLLRGRKPTSQPEITRSSWLTSSFSSFRQPRLQVETQPAAKKETQKT